MNHLPSSALGTSRVQTPLLLLLTRRWATKKSGGSKARQKRRTDGKRLGLKKYPGEWVETGQIIVKQRGTKNHPGSNVGMGRDHTLYAKMSGVVEFMKDPVRDRLFINVRPSSAVMKNEIPSVNFMANAKAPVIASPDEPLLSKLRYGWRNDSIAPRSPSAKGSTAARTFSLYDLSRLPVVLSTERSAVDLDAMASHLKAMNLHDRLRPAASRKENNEGPTIDR